MNVVENAIANIRQALIDYGEYSSQTDVLDDVSDEFIERLAWDNARSKKELRELFSKSPAWDERLDALVINGTRTHDPDPQRIFDLAHMILRPAISRFRHSDDASLQSQMCAAIEFFAPSCSNTNSIPAIKALAPKAYAPNKKPSRVFKSLCDALDVSDDSAGSEFQRLFAQFADELTAKKISYRLYVSLNPAHFLTMSNPKRDRRGETLTSCHSFNSTEYGYNSGCVGYARDDCSFIVFTAADPNEPATLNARKTTRQMFAYKPGNGLLLQSRMYNTSGGTSGAQEESKLYRNLVQREISALEGVPNLWKTKDAYGELDHSVFIGDGFGGYPDWTYEEYDAKISIRLDHEFAHDSLFIGTYGLCVRCADLTSEGVYCDDCKENPDAGYCEHCGSLFDSLYQVCDAEGNELQVCSHCRDESYTFCDRCGEYFLNGNMTHTADGDFCESCLGYLFMRCSNCDTWVRNSDVCRVSDGSGGTVGVCRDCFDTDYAMCGHCGEVFLAEDLLSAHDVNGNDTVICDGCRDRYFESCDECDSIFDSSVMVDGRCPNCYAKEESEGIA